jgi:hypothetical protein
LCYAGVYIYTFLVNICAKIALCPSSLALDSLSARLLQT